MTMRQVLACEIHKVCWVVCDEYLHCVQEALTLSSNSCFPSSLTSDMDYQSAPRKIVGYENYQLEVGSRIWPLVSKNALEMNTIKDHGRSSQFQIQSGMQSSDLQLEIFPRKAMPTRSRRSLTRRSCTQMSSSAATAASSSSSSSSSPIELKPNCAQIVAQVPASNSSHRHELQWSQECALSSNKRFLNPLASTSEFKGCTGMDKNFLLKGQEIQTCQAAGEMTFKLPQGLEEEHSNLGSMTNILPRSNFQGKYQCLDRTARIRHHHQVASGEAAGDQKIWPGIAASSSSEHRGAAGLHGSDAAMRKFLWPSAVISSAARPAGPEAVCERGNHDRSCCNMRTSSRRSLPSSPILTDSRSCHQSCSNVVEYPNILSSKNMARRCSSTTEPAAQSMLHLSHNRSKANKFFERDGLNCRYLLSTDGSMQELLQLENGRGCIDEHQQLGLLRGFDDNYSLQQHTHPPPRPRPARRMNTSLSITEKLVTMKLSAAATVEGSAAADQGHDAAKNGSSCIIADHDREAAAELFKPELQGSHRFYAAGANTVAQERLVLLSSRFDKISCNEEYCRNHEVVDDAETEEAASCVHIDLVAPSAAKFLVETLAVDDDEEENLSSPEQSARRISAAVPFKWEESPGKPKAEDQSSSRILQGMHDAILQPSLLQLPPGRLLGAAAAAASLHSATHDCKRTTTLHGSSHLISSSPLQSNTHGTTVASAAKLQLPLKVRSSSSFSAAAAGPQLLQSPFKKSSFDDHAAPENKQFQGSAIACSHHGLEYHTDLVHPATASSKSLSSNAGDDQNAAPFITSGDQLLPFYDRIANVELLNSDPGSCSANAIQAPAAVAASSKKRSNSSSKSLKKLHPTKLDKSQIAVVSTYHLLLCCLQHPNCGFLPLLLLLLLLLLLYL